MLHGGIHIFGVLKLFILVYALFDEDLFECRKLQRLLLFIPFNFNSLRRSSLVLSTEVRSTSLTVRKCGLLLSITQQLGEDADLAVSKGIERIDGFV